MRYQRGRGARGHRRNFANNAGTQRWNSRGIPSPLPLQLIPFARLSHTCQEQLICNIHVLEQVPYFNASIYLANHEEIGKVDEIFGVIGSSCVSIHLHEPVKAKQFIKDTEFYIDVHKLLPLNRFIRTENKGKQSVQQRKQNRTQSNGCERENFKAGNTSRYQGVVSGRGGRGGRGGAGFSKQFHYKKQF